MFILYEERSTAPNPSILTYITEIVSFVLLLLLFISLRIFSSTRLCGNFKFVNIYSLWKIRKKMKWNLCVAFTDFSLAAADDRKVEKKGNVGNLHAKDVTNVCRQSFDLRLHFKMHNFKDDYRAEITAKRFAFIRKR